ncbi:Uncharacterised protein [Mycobacteroides abscessus subsp. abscessus]|nr:Uncharacterised protein [Mycobacteroides abscessus subsp. abscessus]
MFQLQIVQQACDVHEFVVDLYAIQLGQCFAEEIGAIRVLEHVWGDTVAGFLLGRARECGIGYHDRSELHSAQPPPPDPGLDGVADHPR